MTTKTAKITAEKPHAEMSLEERLDWGHLPVEERYGRAIPPFNLSVAMGHYSASHHRISFDVREMDSIERELDSFTVRNQRETAVKDGKKVRFYVWSCSCGKENCRHITAAKRVYWADFKKKKDAEAWLLENDPTYLTAKMAAAGYVTWGAGVKKAKEAGLI